MGKYAKAYHNSMTWNQSVETCKEDKGHMFMIKDDEDRAGVVAAVGV